MKYKLAIFDMDGTILDTLEDLADCMNYSLEKHSYPRRTIDEVRSFVGNGIHKLVERAFHSVVAQTVALTIVSLSKNNSRCQRQFTQY